MDRLITRSHGRHGLRPLKRALALYRPPPFTRSELERRFFELCRGAGITDQRLAQQPEDVLRAVRGLLAG